MFKKYSSIENDYRDAYINNLKMQGLTQPDRVWVAREKLHGTNFSAIVTADSITWCKRSGPIESGEKFYGHTTVIDKFEPILIDIFEYLKSKRDLNSIQVYGELAGDGVMTQVKYGPKDWYLFDISVDGVLMSDVEVMHLADRFDLKMAPLAAVGSFEELFTLPREFESMVLKPTDFSHDDTLAFYRAPEGNTAEGLVIKPVHPVYDRFGSRVIIKIKSETFKEKEKEKRIVVKEPLTENDQSLLDAMCAYVTKSRLDAVMSKEQYTIKQVGMVIGLLAQDALEDFMKENEFAPDEKARVNKAYSGHVASLVRDNIKEFK